MAAGVLIVCVSVLSLVAGSPLSLADNKAKRSGEVIFYENQQNTRGVSKRSESWPIVQNSHKPAKQEIDDVKKPADADEVEKSIAKEAEKAIEEKAFYQAVQFMVSKLVDEAYSEDGYSTEDMFDDQAALDDDEVEESTLDEAGPIKGKSEDKEANQLASLIKQAEATQNEKKGEDETAVKPKDLTTLKADQSKGFNSQATDGRHNEFPELDEGNHGNHAVTKNYDSDDVTGDDDYNFSNLLDYLDYLNMLKTVEGKLKTRLQGKGYKVQQGTAEKPAKSRKKRSLETSLHLSDRYNKVAERGSPASSKLEVFGEESEDGLCFTAEEVAELKALLVQLAKEKIEAEDLISYLLANEGYGDLYDGEDEYSSREEPEYYSAGRSSLYKLGRQMNKQDKKAPVYSANQWPYEKK